MATRRIRLDLTRSLTSLVMLANLFFFCSSYAQAAKVTLAWNASTSSGVAGYQISYGQTSGSYATRVDVGNQTSYTLTGLNDGATYYFAAKAYNSGKTTFSGFSNEVSTTIASAATASFTATPTSGTAPLTVIFTDASTGSITARSWNFGDGTTSTAISAAKTYTNPGSYTVTLTVTGPGGSNTATKSISAIAAPPVANFTATPTSGTAPLTVTFTDASTGSITARSWNFGDGSTSTTQNPAHAYSTAGTYTVSLTATGPGGTNTKTQSGYVTVSPGTVNTGLVAAYNFEEASGTTVVDASGKGNNGTVSGATRITQGRFGKALSFDGVNDWVTVNDTASLDLTTGMTLEAWVYPTVDMTEWSTVILKEKPDGALYELHANGDQSQPVTSVTVGGRHRVLSGGPWLLANQWTHLAATYDGITQRLYVNGTQVAQRSQTRPIQVSSSPLRLGGNSVWGEFFNGRIDEVRIYNRALNATDIQTDMNRSVATSSLPVTLQECQNWQVAHPEWIFCDDFDDGTPLVRQGRYFEHNDNNGDYVITDGAGLNASKGMRARWQAGEVDAGNIKLAFGRNPSPYMNKGIRASEDFREIYYRVYLKMQDAWQGSPAKLSRATIITDNRWSQAMIAHLWSDSQNHLLVDPVRCVDGNSAVACAGYNNFARMVWLGSKAGPTTIFDAQHRGRWHCVESHVRLNDPGQSNGIQEFWIDGALEARRQDLNFVMSYAGYAINAVFFENYWNTGSPKLQERYFDNIVVSTRPIGCAGNVAR